MHLRAFVMRNRIRHVGGKESSGRTVHDRARAKISESYRVHKNDRECGKGLRIVAEYHPFTQCAAGTRSLCLIISC